MASAVELPYELKQDIFELTAYAHPDVAPRLALVSHQVQQWVEAVIYETIVLGPKSRKQDLFWRTFSSRPPEFFAKRIRSLHASTGAPPAQVFSLFSVCQNLATFTWWDRQAKFDTHLALIASSSNLRRLSVDALTVVGSTVLNFRHPLFKHLTHLEIVNPPIGYDWTSLLEEGALPDLTHLAFGDLYAAHAYQEPSIVPFLEAALASEEPMLKVLILVSRDEELQAALEEDGITDDKRVVCLPSYHHPLNPAEYWEGVARREVQFWETDRVRR
ncbi:unnamed protein product [Mycena citricolor]|uniref:Uncharacterized protein n=1 Tax=Mycena citricolor TaxID=2018698 RepID=A0AAD2H1F1_9AGAR|nr:unnamed protein product [Mycena citricolor]